MNHPLQCRCGTIKGYVSSPDVATRAICYCRDCQAFAHFLECSDAVLDAQGGTEVVATLARHVHFTQGLPALACMSLSARGLLRWYASCCNTPIGNTPRDFKTAYVGLLHNCLSTGAPSLHDSFGPVRMVVNTKFAKGRVKTIPISTVLTVLKVLKSLLGARLSGSYKDSPFFVAETGAPIHLPRALTHTERERLNHAV
jgi:hypothetical protein